MSVDYYSCGCCNVAHYEEFVSSCANCGNSLCVDGIVNTEGVSYNGRFTNTFENDNGEVDPKHCPFCSGDIVEDSDLLAFVAEKYRFDTEAERELLRAKKREVSV